MDAQACTEAAFWYKGPEFLIWLIETCKCPCDKGASIWAAICGHIRILDYLEQSGQEIDDRIIELSAGHKEIVMWGRNRGFEWGNASIEAVRSGKIDYLEWAVSQGCPLLEGACVAAYERCNDPLVEWLQEHGCPFSEEAKKGAEEQRRQHKKSQRK
jgi:hypothetical protein